MSTQILTTKLYIPPVRPQVVNRPRLISRLNDGLYTKLILVSASAGFGKSTVLSQWLDQCDYPTAWLSLDENDSELSRFLRYFVVALQTVDPHIGEDVLEMLQSPYLPPTDAILTTLLNAIATIRQDMIFVLDDYHAIDSSEIDDALTFLLDHLPPQFHLVIATREDPQVPLARLRVRGQLTEVRIADLRFTAEESADFLNQMMNLSLSKEDVIALERRTEGWIAGLQLAALSLRGRDNTSDFIEAFTGSHRFVLDYLVEEVLQHQPDTVREFLLKTAILERFNHALCTAVTTRDDSKQLLDMLERANVFLIALDDTQDWYRYHHLFADALYSHLVNDYPDEISDLHLRASIWFDQHNFAPEAIQHGLKAQSFDHAADLIEKVWPEMDENYQSQTWIRWLKALPDEIVAERPILNLGHSWALLNLGDVDAAEAQLAKTEHWLEKSDEELEQMVVIDIERFKSLPATIAGARAYGALTMGNLEDGIHFAQKAIEQAPSKAHPSYRQGVSLLGVAHWAMGNLQTADTSLQKAAQEMAEVGFVSDAMGMMFILGDIRLTLGTIQSAIIGCERWLDYIENIEDTIILGPPDVHRVLVDLYLETNELENVEQFLQSAEKLAENSVLPNWESRYATTQARVQSRLGNYDEAIEWLTIAENNMTPVPLPKARPFDALKATIWIRQGKLDHAQAWLQAQNLPIDNDVTYLDEFKYITLARLLLARSRLQTGDTSDLETLLDNLKTSAEDAQRNGSLIEILILQSLYFQHQGDTKRAIHAIGQALALAEPEHIIRPFVEEGTPMIAVLKLAVRENIASNFVPQILSAFDLSENESSPAQNLIDPLSDRELEVLQMLGSDLTGPQIADKLMVSLNTMRTHTKNIYSKLGVGSRRTAVRRAEELGLL